MIDNSTLHHGAAPGLHHMIQFWGGLFISFLVLKRPHFPDIAREKMVNVVIAAPVSRFEMESDQAGVSLRVNFRELITDVKRRPIWHGPHQPCNLIGLYGGVWMSPVFLVVLKVALEYH